MFIISWFTIGFLTTLVALVIDIKSPDITLTLGELIIGFILGTVCGPISIYVMIGDDIGKFVHNIVNIEIIRSKTK